MPLWVEAAWDLRPHGALCTPFWDGKSTLCALGAVASHPTPEPAFSRSRKPSEWVAGTVTRKDQH